METIGDCFSLAKMPCAFYVTQSQASRGGEEEGDLEVLLAGLSQGRRPLLVVLAAPAAFH